MKINLNSEEIFDEIGDAMPISEFIEMCECGGFIDYDGFADEIIIGDKVVWSAYDEFKSYLYPSEVLGIEDNKEALLELERLHEGVKIVWYNK